MKALSVLLLLSSIVAYSQSKIEQAKVLFEAKKYDESVKLLKSIDKADPGFADSQYYLGRIACDRHDYDAAEEYLETAIDINPNVADYHYWLGTVWGNIAQESNVLKQGMLAPQIKEQYEEAVELDPKNIDALWGLVTFYTEAPGFMGGDFDKAFEMAASLSKVDVVMGHRARAMIYTKQEKFAEAEKEHLAAYKLNSSLISSVVGFYISQKKYDQAFAVLEEGVKREPDNMLGVYQIGRTSAISGQNLARGEECLRRYLTYQPKENEPSHGGAHMRLGQIYEKKGNKPEAKRSYQAALKIDQSLKEAKEGLDRVSK
jgi:tetratricopeptide (TPR) repeat protein